MIVDTAPILTVTDALVIAAKTDGVLIVADAETRTRGAAAHTRQQLEQVGANIVGGILNNIRRSRATYYPNYYHEPDSYRRRKDERTDGRGKRSGSKDERPNVVSWE